MGSLSLVQRTKEVLVKRGNSEESTLVLVRKLAVDTLEGVSNSIDGSTIFGCGKAAGVMEGLTAVLPILQTPGFKLSSLGAASGQSRRSSFLGEGIRKLLIESLEDSDVWSLMDGHAPRQVLGLQPRRAKSRLSYAPVCMAWLTSPSSINRSSETRCHGPLYVGQNSTVWRGVKEVVVKTTLRSYVDDTELLLGERFCALMASIVLSYVIVQTDAGAVASGVRERAMTGAHSCAATFPLCSREGLVNLADA